jgi:hypothetical protein
MLHRKMRLVQHGDVQIYTLLTTLWLGMLKIARIFKRLRVDCPMNGLMVSTRFSSPIWAETFPPSVRISHKIYKGLHQREGEGFSKYPSAQYFDGMCCVWIVHESSPQPETGCRVLQSGLPPAGSVGDGRDEASRVRRAHGSAHEDVGGFDVLPIIGAIPILADGDDCPVH